MFYDENFDRKCDRFISMMIYDKICRILCRNLCIILYCYVWGGFKKMGGASSSFYHLRIAVIVFLRSCLENRACKTDKYHKKDIIDIINDQLITKYHQI